MNKIQGILTLLVYICVGTAIVSAPFVSSFNVQNTIRWTSLFGIIGIGAAMVIITGGIDLSIGSLIGLVGCLLPMMLTEWGWPLGLALGGLMVLAISAGLAHGLLVTRLGLQPFVVTLCGLLIYRGLARTITDDQTKGFGSAYDDSLRLLAIGRPCTVATVIAGAGLCLLVYVLWQYWQQSGRNGSRTSATSHRLSALSFLSRPARRRTPGLSEESGSSASGLVVPLLVGLTLLVVGSSPYWHLWHVPLVSWSMQVPEDAARLPEHLLHWLGGWVFVPAVLVLAAGMLATDVRRNSPPLLAVFVCAGLVPAALYVVRQPDAWFGESQHYADRLRIAAAFGALAPLTAALIWLQRRLVNVSQPQWLSTTGKVAAFGGVLWLAGNIRVGATEVPAPLFTLVVLAVAAGIFLNHTVYGRYLLALGRNEQAAHYSGINVNRMKILAYMLCSGFAGVAGILFALDINSIQPSGHGNFYELYAIAAAVLGGCSLRGGEGSVLGVIIGAAVLQVLRNAVSIMGIPSQREFAIIGIVILLGAAADEIVRRLAQRRQSVLPPLS